jgi:hypothetical protein
VAKVGASETAMKTCTKCGETKTLEDFFGDASRRDGLTGRCKPCHRADAKRYREKESFKKKNAQRAAKWRSAHPDRVAEAAKRDMGKTVARVRIWRGSNKEKVLAQSLRRRPKQLEYYKEQAMKISDQYVVNCLLFPIELAPEKREALQFERLRRQLKQTYKEVFK